ncbi:hypothetical protein [Nocardiopsis deserti]|uniref:hypothetical protein n=1 Tax=Nocardiopsis deserti TaxID=2605988 RepID=UPI0016811586|nr:hypothetical protein [Nocardiopsis deserti]
MEVFSGLPQGDEVSAVFLLGEGGQFGVALEVEVVDLVVGESNGRKIPEEIRDERLFRDVERTVAVLEGHPDDAQGCSRVERHV